MEEILAYLNIKDVQFVDVNGIDTYLYDFNKDKLIVALKTNNLDDIEVVSAGLISKLNTIRENISNKRNKDPLIKKDLSMFLWDLYIICFYPNEYLKKEEEDEIYKIERDKYLARKIIIPYNQGKLTEMRTIYNKYVHPEIYLNETNKPEENPEGELDDLKYREFKEKIQEIEEFLLIRREK